MSKYNEKKEPRVPTEVNLMGEKAYKLDPKEELVSTVLTTFVQKSYYESENEILKRIKDAASKCDPLFVAKLAIYTRDEANMRSSSHVLAGELASRASGTIWGKRFYQKVAIRPDDMSEIIGYYKNVMKQKALPNAMRIGFKRKLESMDAYLIDKYKMGGKEISLVDLVNLLHPKANQKNAEAYKLLIKEGGKGIDKLYSSKILEKEMSKAGQVSKEKVQEAKKEAIESVLDNVKGMPIFNLLRNLRNIILYAPDSIEEAISQLTTAEKIHKSRLLPFRFLSAYNEIDKLSISSVSKTEKSSVVFEDEIATREITSAEFTRLKPRVLGALEIAIEYSCTNIPELEGNTAILIDHSGSMGGDMGGKSLASVLSNTKMVDIADVFAAMLISKQSNVYVGLFGDRLIPFKLDRKDGILATSKKILALGRTCGGGTEAGIYTFFRDIIANPKPISNIIIFSDQVIGDGTNWYGTDRSKDSGHGTFQVLFKKFRGLYPTTKVVSVDIHQTSGSTVFNKNYNVTQVAGWSEKIFDIISSGTAGYKALIEEIEKIVI